MRVSRDGRHGPGLALWVSILSWFNEDTNAEAPRRNYYCYRHYHDEPLARSRLLRDGYPGN